MIRNMYRVLIRLPYGYAYLPIVVDHMYCAQLVCAHSGHVYKTGSLGRCNLSSSTLLLQLLLKQQAKVSNPLLTPPLRCPSQCPLGRWSLFQQVMGPAMRLSAESNYALR